MTTDEQLEAGNGHVYSEALTRAEAEAMAWAVDMTLPPMVRPPALPLPAASLKAAWRMIPALPLMARAMPHVRVEGASVNIADHLDGDYHPDQSLIRVECQHRPAVIAHILLHEYAHAWDHHHLDDDARAELLLFSGASAWHDVDLDWYERGEEWFAEAFVHVWWPEHAGPPPLPWRFGASMATDAIVHHFDVRPLARAARGSRLKQALLAMLRTG